MKNKVKYHRQKQKITQEEMGKMLGITRQTVSALEQGRYDPPISMAYIISLILDIPLDKIFEFDTINITSKLENEIESLEKKEHRKVLEIPTKKGKKFHY